MSLSDRMDYTGLGYEGQTPYYNLYIDYGGAFQAAADAFYADATSLCPIDTGFLYSTIGSSADGEGMDAYADADYAVYVNDWAGFFDAGWQTALVVADAYCDAVYEDAMIEEYEMLTVEMEEALGAQMAIIEEIMGNIETKEQEISMVENAIMEVENQIAMLEGLDGLPGIEEALDELYERLADLENQLEGLEQELEQLELEKQQEEIQYEIIEDYYATLLAYY